MTKLSMPFLSDEFLSQCQQIERITQSLLLVVSDALPVRLKIEKMDQCVKAYLKCAQDLKLQSLSEPRIWWKKVEDLAPDLHAQMIHPDEFNMAVVALKEEMKKSASQHHSVRKRERE